MTGGCAERGSDLPRRMPDMCQSREVRLPLARRANLAQGEAPLSPPSRRCVLLDAQLFRSHRRALHAIGDLLEGDVPGRVWRAVIRLDVHGKRRESAVVGSAELVLRDIFGGQFKFAKYIPKDQLGATDDCGF